MEPDKNNDDVTKGADFEAAISAAGFGWYSALLLLVVFILSLGITFQISTIPYILYRAECDIELTLLNKGIVSAMVYAGMSTSSIFWSYISNVNGRKKVLVYGSFLSAVSMFGSAVSRHMISLSIFQYIGGFAISGPTSVIISYQAEMYSKHYRNTIIILRAAMFATSSVLLISLSVIILPKTWNFHIIYWNLHSWQILMALGVIPLMLSGLLFMLFPESPKFLMSQERNDKALEIFRTIYKYNKCKSRNNYPIKQLQQLCLRKTKVEFRPLLHKPYRSLAIITVWQSFCISLAVHVLRLWLPQIFASFEEYNQMHDDESNMCIALEYIVNKTEHINVNTMHNCIEAVGVIGYRNNLIMAAGNFLIYIISGALAKYFNLKYLLIFGTTLAGCASLALYWSISPVMTLMLSTQVIANASFALAALLSAKSTLFPTAQRTIIVSCSTVFEHVGAIIGSILFSVLLSVEYVAPFVLLATVLFFASILGVFLPSMKRASSA